MAFTREPETAFAGSYYATETAMAEGSSFSTFAGMSVTPQIQASSSDIQVQGLLLPAGVMRGAESSVWQGQGYACYEDMKFFESVVSHTASTPTTYTLSSGKLKSINCVVSGFSLQGDTEKIQTGVNFVGKKVQQQSSTITPTVVQPTVYDPMKTTVVLGSGEPSKVNAWSVEVQGLWNIANYIDDTKQNLIQTMGSANFSLTLPLESPALTYLSEKGKKTCTITNTTDTNLGFSISFDFYWQAPDSPGDTNGLWTINLKGTIINKSPSAITITATNSQS